MAPPAPARVGNDGNALYNACLTFTKTHPDGIAKTFFQDELLPLSGQPDAAGLMNVAQVLCNAQLLRNLRSGGVLCWKIRPRDVATKLVSVAQEDYVIYVQIEDAGQKGLWSRSIKAKVGMSQQLVGKSLTRLENKGLIKAIKNVKSPAQKVYMLSHFQPGEELTGGVFFDGADIDEALVNELSNLIVFFVRSRSWIITKPAAQLRKAKANGKAKRAIVAPPPDEDDDNDSDTKMSDDDGDVKGSGRPASKQQRKESALQDMEDYVSTSFSARRAQRERAYPAFTHPYPQPEAILSFVVDSGALRGGKAAQLNLTAIERLVEVLVMDEKLERVGEGFRSVKGVYQQSEEAFVHGGEGPGTGLTEAPCGRCPVFEVCGDGGPVNAGSCPYWKEWLEGQ